MKTALMKSAAKKLELVDLSINESKFFWNKHVDPSEKYPEFIYQTKVGVSVQELAYTTSDDDDELNILRFIISFGVRAVKSDEMDASKDGSLTTMKHDEIDDETLDIFYTIEADYRIDYIVKSKLSTDEIREFSNFNAVHNAWPFWRQHVSYMTHNANLPHVLIPLYRGNEG